MRILLDWQIPEEHRIYLEHELGEYGLFIGNPEDQDLSDVEVVIAGRAEKSFVQQLPNLGLIQSMISGVSHIDLDYALANGITVTSTKGVNSVDVAEHSLMIILGLLKNIGFHTTNVKQGIWEKIDSKRLSEVRFGIVGLGSIGSSIGRYLKQMGCLSLNATRYRPELGDSCLNLDHLGGTSDLDTLISLSDLIVVSVPKTPLTLSLINSKNIHLLRGKYLVNVSRGSIIDMEAVSQAVLSGSLLGFGTDVFPKEPYNFSDPVFSMPNVIATPHVAAYNRRTQYEAIKFIVSNVKSYLEGKPLLGIVDLNRGY